MRSYGSSAEEEIMRSLLGGSSSSSSGDFSSAISILAFILAIAATVLAFVFILSKKGRSSQNPFIKFLVNVCDFRCLIIEKILKALYIFSTAFTILYGFLGIFDFGSYMYGATLLQSLLTMILGPIAIRIIYELIMLAVLAVKNIIQINNKLSKLTGDDASANVSFDTDLSDLKKYAPTQPAAPAQPHMVYCEKCGTPDDENAGGCPNCNK